MTPRDEEPPLPEKVILIHESLTRAKIPYAFGGALALAYYADPQVTIDIDVKIFLPVERWSEIVEELVALGVEVERLDSDALEQDGQCRLWWGDSAVDLLRL